MLGGGVGAVVDAADVGEGFDGVEEKGVVVVFFVAEIVYLGAEVVALFGVVVVPAVVGFLADLFGEVFFLQGVDVGVDFFQFIFSFGEFCAAGGGAEGEGYLLKNVGLGGLVMAMRTVLAGRRYFSNEVAGLLMDARLRGYGRRGWSG